jgi:hypothetical protein
VFEPGAGRRKSARQPGAALAEAVHPMMRTPPSSCPDILESNGSSSMAGVCRLAGALMDAGVNLGAMAGIATWVWCRTKKPAATLCRAERHDSATRTTSATGLHARHREGICAARWTSNQGLSNEIPRYRAQARESPAFWVK